MVTVVLHMFMLLLRVLSSSENTVHLGMLRIHVPAVGYLIA